MYNISYEPQQILFLFVILRGWELIYTLSYARDEVNIHSYVTLVIIILRLYLHPRHPYYAFEPKSSTMLDI